MNLIRLVLAPADLRGRTNRTQWWLTHIAALSVFLALAVVMSFTPRAYLELVANASTVYTVVAGGYLLLVSVARLHDGGLPAWFLTIALLPFVGLVIVIVQLGFLKDGQINDWGGPA